VNVAVGDVLLGRTTPNTSPYGRVWLNGRWLPISLERDATFLILTVTDLDDEFTLVPNEEKELLMKVVALNTGDRMTLVMTCVAVATKLTVMRGESVVDMESCGRVLS
jgi:hypothetical protein